MPKGKSFRSSAMPTAASFQRKQHISTLKILYGRPEAIVQSAIRKVRSLPSPQVERLDTVVNFALTVENLVAIIEACGDRKSVV